MQAFGLSFYQVLGLGLLIMGIVFVATKNDHEGQQSILKDLGIALIIIGILLILSTVKLYDLLPKGPQQNNGDSSDFDMLGGKVSS
jgi:hypothetical protein